MSAWRKVFGNFDLHQSIKKKTKKSTPTPTSLRVGKQSVPATELCRVAVLASALINASVNLVCPL